MVTIYPHTVTIRSVGDSTQDGDGNFEPGSDSSFGFKGRFETNSKSNILTAADGKQIVYSGIVYGKYSTPNIAIGADIEVANDNGPIAKGKVLQFSRGQLNARIWIGNTNENKLR
jgi:hypothetical protein